MLDVRHDATAVQPIARRLRASVANRGNDDPASRGSVSPRLRREQETPRQPVCDPDRCGERRPGVRSHRAIVVATRSSTHHLVRRHRRRAVEPEERHGDLRPATRLPWAWTRDLDDERDVRRGANRIRSSSRQSAPDTTVTGAVVPRGPHGHVAFAVLRQPDLVVLLRRSAGRLPATPAGRGSACLVSGQDPSSRGSLVALPSRAVGVHLEVKRSTRCGAPGTPKWSVHRGTEPWTDTASSRPGSTTAMLLGLSSGAATAAWCRRCVRRA